MGDFHRWLGCNPGWKVLCGFGRTIFGCSGAVVEVVCRGFFFCLLVRVLFVMIFCLWDAVCGVSDLLLTSWAYRYGMCMAVYGMGSVKIGVQCVRIAVVCVDTQ